MAADIYSRAGNDFGGAFAADAAKVVFGSDFLGAGTATASGTRAGGVGLLTQNLQIQYSQAVTRLYEIGSNATFLVAGRTQGQASMGRVLGPRAVNIAFYTKYGNVCNAGQNNINFEADAGCPENAGLYYGGGGATASGSYTFIIRYVVITNIGIAVAAQDMIINEQLQLMFISLEVK